MHRKCGLLISSIVLCLGLSCPQTTTPPDSILNPRQWSQFQCDEQGSGFNAVHTNYAVPVLKKWARNTGGDTAYSSPVVSLQNTIWIGTANMRLIGYDANGFEVANRQVAGPILSTPAVDPDARVFFIYQHHNTIDETHVCYLAVFDPANGNIAYTLNNPMPPTWASPKIWRDYVFVSSNNSVYVFHRWTLELIAQEKAYQDILCGTADFPFWYNVLVCVATATTADLLGLAECYPGFLQGHLSSPDPSIAIVDNSTIVEDVNRPIVLVGSDRTLTAFNFDPSNANMLARLQTRWRQEIVPLDCDHFDETVDLTTPAVLDANQVVVGGGDGLIRSFDVGDGTPLWNYSAYASAPPVASLRQIYIPTDYSLLVLDSNGAFISQSPLVGRGGAAALSLDFVYVTTSKGIQTFTLEPGSGGAIDTEYYNDSYLGPSAPAIAQDGTIYVASQNGVVEAYENGTINIPIASLITAISWRVPQDGQLIAYPAGQVLKVGLGNGSGFTGDITIQSDIDGDLCQFHVDGVNDAMCTADKPLTLGDHTLTVFAVDPSGAQQSVQVHVTVVDNALTVKITSPEEGAILFSTEPVSLAAQVFDPDETIPDDKIRWHSDIDGDLGTGRVLDLMLTNGTHTITCTAKDAMNHEASDTVSILVTNPIG